MPKKESGAEKKLLDTFTYLKKQGLSSEAIVELTKKVLKVAWAVIAVLIILSMVIFFAPGLVNVFLG